MWQIETRCTTKSASSWRDWVSSSFFLSGDTGATKKRSQPAISALWCLWHRYDPDPQRQQKRSLRCCHCMSFARAVGPASANGKTGDAGIERITTQTVFDISEVPQRSRGAGACRRLAKLLAELGWTAVRVRGLTRGGYREQVRGYCRDPGHSPVRRHTT